MRRQWLKGNFPFQTRMFCVQVRRRPIRDGLGAALGRLLTLLF